MTGLLSAVVLTLLLAPVSGVQAQASNYLDALREEASELKLDKGTRTTPKRAPVRESGVGSLGSGSGASGGAIEGLDSNLSNEQFAQFLKTNYMGSYLFYRRLSEEGRAEVYQFYLENPDPKLIRERILEINKN